MNNSKSNITTPTIQQIEWANCEIGVIIHCDIEICQPDWLFLKNNKIQKPPDLSIFNPKLLDTDQWIKTAKAAGAKYAVLTAKHVSGFTLFPDEKYDYSIKDTPYLDGNGDIVGSFIKSCKKYDIKPGLYYSCEANAHLGIHKGSGNLPFCPSKEWDDFTELVTRHLTHLWSKYGKLFEIWFDGGLLEHGPNYLELLRKYQPEAVCFQGPSEFPSLIRWVGNEDGLAPYPCWSTSDVESDFDGTIENHLVGKGNPNGKKWNPAETDVPLRYKQWFWIPDQEALVAPVGEIMKWYYNSVGRNANLLIGIVIDQDGLVPQFDVETLTTFGKILENRFLSPIGETQGNEEYLEIVLDKEQSINNIILMEDISEGHIVRNFILYVSNSEKENQIVYQGSAIGHKHIIKIDPIQAKKVSLHITKMVNKPCIKKFALYNVNYLEDEVE